MGVTILSKRGQEPAGTGRALNYVCQGSDRCGTQRQGCSWGDVQRLEGQGTREAPLPGTLQCESHTGALFQSYRDESGIPEVKNQQGNKNCQQVNAREIPQRNKGCSSKKVTQPAAQLRHPYTNAGSTGNKQEEFVVFSHTGGG